jgi:preprotein translocase subunit YajC
LINTVLFQQQTQAPGGIISFLPLLLILGIFYLIVFLPARRRQKKVQMMIDNLKAGDKVITSGGIYGTIVGFKDDRIQLRVAENVKIELSRSAITALQGSEQE